MDIIHFSRLILFASIISTIFFATSCAEDDDGPTLPTEEYKTSGFVLGSVVPATGAFTAYAEYSSDLPDGDIDMTRGESAPTQFFAADCGSFFFGRPREVGAFGTAKFAIDAETEQIVELGRITTAAAQFLVEIIDDDLGFSTGFGTLEVIAFNPQDMSVIQVIDLAPNSPLPEGGEGIIRGISGLYYNDVTEKLIAALNFDISETPQFYDLEDVHIEVIDVPTLTRDGSSTQPQAMYPRQNGTDQAVIDASGNLYILAQGSYGLDGALGPFATARSLPQILKVDGATSKFDTDYPWLPVAAAGFGTNFAQAFTGMVGTGSNRAYGFTTAATDPPRLLELLPLVIAGTISEEEQTELNNLLFESESGKLAELDLSARTISIVDEVPFSAAFNYPYIYNYDGLIYSQVTSQAFNGYYVTDPNNGNASNPVFNVTAGGFATDLIRLSDSCN